MEHKIPIDGAANHGVSESLYLRDPDQNGVELYWDRPPADWPRTPSGELIMYTGHLDLQELLSAAEDPARAAAEPIPNPISEGPKDPVRLGGPGDQEALDLAEPWRRLRLDEFKQVCIDQVCMRSRHSMEVPGW